MNWWFPKISRFHNSNPCTDFSIHLCGLKNAKVIVHRRTQQENLVSWTQAAKAKFQCSVFFGSCFQRAPKTWEDKLHRSASISTIHQKKKHVHFPVSFLPVWNQTSVTPRRPSQIKALQVVPTNEGQSNAIAMGFDTNAPPRFSPLWRISTSGFLSTCTSGHEISMLACLEVGIESMKTT